MNNNIKDIKIPTGVIVKLYDYRNPVYTTNTGDKQILIDIFEKTDKKIKALVKLIEFQNGIMINGIINKGVIEVDINNHNTRLDKIINTIINLLNISYVHYHIIY